MKNYFWNNKNVFITGATGLLGPWLIKDLLEKQANVFVLVRDIIPSSLFFIDGLDKKTNVIFGDLLDFQLLQRVLNEFDIDTVFHLGAQAIVGIANRSPLSTFKSNIEGTWNLLEACRLSPWIKKVIIASSDKAYGEHEKLPYKENISLQGRFPYDVSKSCVDLISQSYFHTYKLPVCVTRCGNFFGGGDLHLNRIVPGTIKSILYGKNPIIRTNGLFVRDYVYVKDVSDAYITLAQKMENDFVIGQCFNFSTDQPFNVIEIVDLILDIMKCNHLKPIIQNQSCNEIPEQNLCSQKAKNILGWEAKFGVKVGLQETVKWYKNFFDEQKNKIYISGKSPRCDFGYTLGKEKLRSS
ncbi:GDP-mannose 4,6-dehydratase [Candidatus Babeliales bacterium]|nr:GDP-mannose 4,6-dehydratase [Candidatus Babeliales bacterium]